MSTKSTGKSQIPTDKTQIAVYFNDISQDQLSQSFHFGRSEIDPWRWPRPAVEELKSAERLNASKTFPWEKGLNMMCLMVALEIYNKQPRKRFWMLAQMYPKNNRNEDTRVWKTPQMEGLIDSNSRESIAQHILQILELDNLEERKQMIRPRLLRAYLYHQTKQVSK
uniref:Uncharacterized protein n=1 Tax=Brassica campestris TaxID=3711 RepID=A0A3P5ZXK5_BRACM|nr:unnamed protein product [Brassica rapa]